ncbi:MAG: hypothetical protein JSV79_12465 [Armatimonadota bacterium]|nr:MAG: hypothetical protein JSV79_12465 [Armatimonadota bacterium]
MAPQESLVAALATLAVGSGVTAVLAGRERPRLCGYVAVAFMVLAGIGVYYAAGSVFSRGPVALAAPLLTLPALGAELTIHIDHLSALFLLVIATIGILVTLYSVEYVQRYRGQSLVRYYPLLLLFLASVVAVVSVPDMLMFLVAWELMTLLSYALVVFDKESPVSLRAGLKYFIITHVATACMVVAAIILYTQAKSFSFTALGGAMASLSQSNPALLHLVLGLFLIGFGTKAGMLPFGDWLPDAYPAAPAAASAAFAGSMTKLGIYGIIRVFCQMLPVSHFSLVWGGIIALFGTISIFVGTLTALAQDDSKRLLSFHVIGQIGYMMLGIGLGIYFLPVRPALAVVGMIAGTFHLINHVCYKSCLFLNAGAVLYRTGTRDLNLVGGLARVMPLTATTALIASLSIAGVPPFSGFSSKWMIFQASAVGGIDVPFFMVFAIVAIFISIATLASFLKFLGTAFFGRLHVPEGAAAESDVPASMKIPQVALAVLCVLFGLAPVLAISRIYPAISGVLPAGYAPSAQALFGTSPAGVTLNLGEGPAGAWYPLPLVAVLLGGLVVAHLIYRSGGARARLTEVWHCGEAHAAEEIRYRAHSYYQPFKEFLRMRIGARRTSGIYPHLPIPRVGNPVAVRRALDIDAWLYYPLLRWGGRVLNRFSRTHLGIPQVYVLWMVGGMILAIVVLFWLS